EHERRNLAERILLAQRVRGIARVRLGDLDAAIEAENDRGHPDLAAERRRRRGSQEHDASSLLRKKITRHGRSGGQDRSASKQQPRVRRAEGRRQPVTTRFTAFGPLPFLSGSTSKLMRWPSLSDFKPARSTAVMCTNTSRPPSSGLMKP